MMESATATRSYAENYISDLGAEMTPKILAMTTSLLMDRVFLYTEFLNELNAYAAAKVWAASVRNPCSEEEWNSCPAAVESFPHVKPFKQFPYNYLRRLNEFVWDFRQRTPSRLSMWRHVRSEYMKPTIRALRLPARALAALRLERVIEDRLEEFLLSYTRSREAVKRLSEDRPDVILTTGPYQFEQPAVVMAARNLGIPVIAMIPSWDNPSTKNRMVFKYDGYIVWSEQIKRELLHFYPYTRDVPIYVVGAPQFDVFFNDRFYQSREEFCGAQGLRADLPIILYAIGSPNFLRGEVYGALDLCERLSRGELGDAQVIIRPHPLHHKGGLAGMFDRFSPRVMVQQPSSGGPTLARSQDTQQILEWVNSFRHADVVVNLSSTVTVDAAIFDRPVVNLDYDPAPGSPQQQVIKEVNHVWNHFKPVAESGGVWMVNNSSELVEAVRTYLKRPELHREKRRWVAEYVCGYLDGRCGERMARAVLDFIKNEHKDNS